MSRESKVAGKRILVTGATGFLGRHLMPILAAHYGAENVCGVSSRDYDLMEPGQVKIPAGSVIEAVSTSSTSSVWAAVTNAIQSPAWAAVFAGSYATVNATMLGVTV